MSAHAPCQHSWTAVVCLDGATIFMPCRGQKSVGLPAPKAVADRQPLAEATFAQEVWMAARLPELQQNNKP